MINKYGWFFGILISAGTLFGQAPLQQSLEEAEQLLETQLGDGQSSSYRNTLDAWFQNFNKDSLLNTSLYKDESEPSFQKRLWEIWVDRSQSPQHFEAVVAFHKPAPFSPLEALKIKGERTRQPTDLTRLNVIPLQLMAQEVQDAVETMPDMYEQLVALREAVHANAKELHDQNARSHQSLEANFVANYETILQTFRTRTTKAKTLRHVISASQIPSMGGVYPAPPLLDPSYLLAWEEVLIAAPSVAYKSLLVDFLKPLATAASAPCYGMVLKQAIYGFHADETDQTCKWLIYKLLDYFRDNPSEQAATALAEAVRFAKNLNTRFDLPIKSRLQAEGWPELLAKMESKEALARTLSELKSIEK